MSRRVAPEVVYWLSLGLVARCEDTSESSTLSYLVCVVLIH